MEYILTSDQHEIKRNCLRYNFKNQYDFKTNIYH